MKYTARKFQQNQYDKCDSISKKVFVEFIENRGHTIVSKEEDYNHDIVTEKDGTYHYFELETKRGYPFRGRESFPFQSVSFLGRKKRLHEIKHFHYIILCWETKYAVGCHSSDIFLEKYAQERHLSNKERNGLDRFYRVPKNKCYFFKSST